MVKGNLTNSGIKVTELFFIRIKCMQAGSLSSLHLCIVDYSFGRNLKVIIT